MAGEKLTQRPVATTADTNDLVHIVDISDTTDSPEGTSKQITKGNLTAGLISGNETITLTGDATGSGTTSIPVVVVNDSHTHDTRYYTETESDARFLGIGATAVNSNLLDSLDSSQFLRKDISQTLTGDFTATGNSTANVFSTTVGTNGATNFYKADGCVMATQWEDNYYRQRRGVGGDFAGWRWDNFDTTLMTLENSTGSLSVLGQTQSNSFKLGNWTIETSGTSLVFKLSGVTKLTLDDAGDLTATTFSEV